MEQIKNMRLYISFICLLVFSCASPVMAQKQSKVEKLLKFLVNNENEKFTKNRDKLDAETATAFEAEVKLTDLCRSNLESARGNRCQRFFPGLCRCYQSQLYFHLSGSRC